MCVWCDAPSAVATARAVDDLTVCPRALALHILPPVRRCRAGLRPRRRPGKWDLYYQI